MMGGNPVPRLARWLLSRVLHSDDRRFALSDLDEGFERHSDSHGPASARRWYWMQAARSLLPALENRLARLPRTLVGDLLDDVRFALRTLVKSPAVAVVTVLSLAVGIAAATAVFTAANAFLLRPIAAGISDPDALVSVYTTESDGERYGQTSYLDFDDLSHQVDAFADTAAIRMGVLQIGGSDQPRRIIAEIVSGNYFQLLGITLPIGRGFLPQETAVGRSERVVIIGQHLWKERFAASPDVVGETLDLDGKPFTVVGVAPAGMTSRLLALKAAVWVPLGIPGGTFNSDETELSERADRSHFVVARLRAGRSAEQAQAQLDVLSTRLHERYSRSWEDAGGRPLSLTLIPASEGTLPPDWINALARSAGLVMLAAGLILLVACSNVASLFLARAGKRSKEMAVRLALGASRRRLVTLLLTESLLLSIAAGALGVFLSTQAMSWMDSLTLPIGDLSVEFDFGLDHRVLLFGVVLSVATSVLFGLAPALEASKPSILPSLQGASAGIGARRRRFGLRDLLVVGQVAIALIFVVGAGVTLRSFNSLVEANWGVIPDRIAIMSRKLPEEIASGSFLPYYSALISRLESKSGVEQAQLATGFEAGGVGLQSTAEIRVDGYERSEGESLLVPVNSVTPGYIEMLGIRLLRGRTIHRTDVEGDVRATVVSESFVRRFWGDREGLGEQFHIVGRYELGDPREATGDAYEIVGVVADARYEGLASSGRMYIWTALYQHPSRRIMLLLQGRTGAKSMVRLLLSDADPDDHEFALITPRTYEDQIGSQFGFLVLIGKVLGLAGAFGLSLATIGIYGVVSFAITRRTKELAIRQAVGAPPAQVVRSVLREGIVLSTGGLVLGLAVVIPLAALLRADIEGVSPIDPFSTLVGAAILMVVALGASLIPARRVMALDLVATLRADN